MVFQELGTPFFQDQYAELPLMLLNGELKAEVKKLQDLKQKRLNYVKDLLTKVTRD